jgi:actin cytoskeleton-regulatory complex protein SLA1
VRKLQTSKQLSTPPETLEEPITSPERPRSAAKTVHFDAAPAIIPDLEDSDEEPEREDSQEYDPNAAVVLYDFTADGDDELTVAEGEDLIVLERDSDDWWKVRNSKGQEGVVPASYVEVRLSVPPMSV